MTYTINIVAYNSDIFLDDVLNHCWKLQKQPQAVIIIDNASTDDTLGIIARHQKEHSSLIVLRNPSNGGFAKGHNQALALSRRKNVDAALVLNPDVFLEPNSTSILLASLERHASCGSVTGKLFRMGADARESRQIDSAGLQVTRSLRILDRGSGELERGQYDQPAMIFGASAAATMYRIASLDDVREEHMDFDESFFAYKEDVDLAFRLQWRGWECRYEPNAIGFHSRSHQGGSFKQILSQRKHRSSRTRQYSCRNHYWTIAKNIPSSVFIRYLPWILVREFFQNVFFLFSEPRTLFGIGQAIRGLPRIRRQRRRILSSRVLPTVHLQQWISATI